MTKKILIIFTIFFLFINLFYSSYGWQGAHLGYLNEYVQYENGVPKFMMPNAIFEYLQNDCPDYALYLDGQYEIVICKNGWSTNTGRWYICFLEPDTQVWLTGGNDPYLQSDKEIFYYRCNDDGNYNWEKVQGITMNVYPAGEYPDGEICYCGASTIPIYNSDKTTTFFQGRPLDPTKVVLLNPMTVAKLPEEIVKLTIILTKVGLTAFSIFLLVYLIKSKIWRPL